MTVRDPLYLPEAEIARRIGVTLDQWRAKALVLERSGLPRPDPMFDGKRYWPAVRAFLDRRHGVGQDGPLQPDGQEDLDYVRHGRTRARAQVPAARQ